MSCICCKATLPSIIERSTSRDPVPSGSEPTIEDDTSTVHGATDARTGTAEIVCMPRPRAMRRRAYRACARYRQPSASVGRRNLPLRGNRTARQDGSGLLLVKVEIRDSLTNLTFIAITNTRHPIPRARPLSKGARAIPSYRNRQAALKNGSQARFAAKPARRRDRNPTEAKINLN